MSLHDITSEDKTEVGQHELGTTNVPGLRAGYHQRPLHSKVSAEMERIDAIVLSDTTTAESFKHLDEKKILRKVRPVSKEIPRLSPVYILTWLRQMDTRLIPVLALLYLLSFLDRELQADHHI